MTMALICSSISKCMKQKIFDVMPECYVDTNLIEYLLCASVNHQHCCSKVVGQLNNKFVDRFAIGIIDDDKIELGYKKECDVIAKTEHLTLMKHKSRPQYLITIHPAIDKFILDCSKEQGVHTVDFGIPSELKEFTKISKSITSNSDERFKSLFAAINKNHEFCKLKLVLKYLLEHKYETDISQLSFLFNYAS